jgi:hypothetical protein
MTVGVSQLRSILPISHVSETGLKAQYLSPLEQSNRGILQRLNPALDEGYTTHLIAKEATAFIAEHAKKPFFLYVPFNAVHEPLQVPAEYI